MLRGTFLHKSPNPSLTDSLGFNNLVLQLEVLGKSEIPLSLTLSRNASSQVDVLASDYFISNSTSRKERRVPILRARKDSDNTCDVSVEKYKFTSKETGCWDLERIAKIQAPSQAV